MALCFKNLVRDTVRSRVLAISATTRMSQTAWDRECKLLVPSINPGQKSSEISVSAKGPFGKCCRVTLFLCISLHPTSVLHPTSLCLRSAVPLRDGRPATSSPLLTAYSCITGMGSPLLKEAPFSPGEPCPPLHLPQRPQLGAEWFSKALMYMCFP